MSIKSPELEEQKLKEAAQNEIDSFLATAGISIKEAMRQMSRVGEKILFVVDEERKLLGSLTDGDIRRWVLKDGNLSATIEDVYFKDPLYVNKNYDINAVRQMMLEQKVYWIPVVDAKKRICEIILWDKAFSDEAKPHHGTIDVPVAIMAGGKGTRLDPFTKILPKPLIPIGDKTIIEIILGKLQEYGVNEFFLSVSHKSRMIKAFFEEINPTYKIKYIEEEIPLGTAGGLRSLIDKIDKEVLVSNCDIIIDCNYADFLKFHRDHGYAMTMVGSFRHFTIPYGVCALEDDGCLMGIKEKPEYDFLVSTGMYIMTKEALEYIPEGKRYDMNELINRLIECGEKIGVYPIDEKSWIDIGQWEEYHKSVQALKAE